MITEVELQRIVDKAEERFQEKLVVVTAAIDELKSAFESLQNTVKKPTTKA